MKSLPRLFLIDPVAMARMDAAAGQSGIPLYDLMERAGQAVAASVLRYYPQAQRFVVLCGGGNNGGDGYVAARALLQSGAVVAAGGIVWSGRGSFWVPDSWRPAADIRCGETRAAPSDQVLEGESCADSGTTPAQAMSTALSTNLAQGLAAKGAFTARTYLYMPSVGLCDPGVAEWLVILSRQ